MIYKRRIAWGIARHIIFCLVAMILVCGAVMAQGATGKEAFPNREIRFIVPYSAGGASDRTARQLAFLVDKLKLLDYPIVVTNIPGAGTMEALNEVVRSEPDGHTLLLHHNVFITQELLGTIDDRLTWHEGFEPVAQVLETPLTIAVLKESRWEKLADLFTEIEENPGEIKFGIPGVATPQSFGLQALLYAYKQKTGIELKIHPVYYEGGAATRTALLQGEIDVTPGISMDTVPDAKSGLCRILAVGTNIRIPSLPDVPTIEEEGFPMPLDAGGQSLRMAVWAPKGTSVEIISTLSELLKHIVETDEWRDYANSIAAIPIFRNSQELRRVFQSDAEALRPVVSLIKEQ